MAALVLKFKVNGADRTLEVDPDSKLLWVLRDRLKLFGTRYGCGVAQCGACMVLVDGRSEYACQLSISAVAGKTVTTIEGLDAANAHPLQQAWVAEQVPQCGYCQSGQILRAVDLLSRNPRPSRGEIKDFMSTNLCRCGTYPRIVKAIERAAVQMNGAGDADV